MRHCPSCTCPPKPRKAIAKVSRRERIRAVNGIQELPGGGEKCVTKRAWWKRREEVWLRDSGVCIHIEQSEGRICGKMLSLSEAHIHHVIKRSLGRDDRASNLITLCPEHHRLYDSTPQWSKP